MVSFILEKKVRLVANCLNIALLISVLFFSIPRQVFPFTGFNLPVSSAAVSATNLTLHFSTFLGGSAKDSGKGVAVTDDGSCYVTGLTESSDFSTKSAFDSTYNGDTDAFLMKFAANGSLLWSTYFGGNNWDYGYDVTVAADGSCYVIGFTNSCDFPTLHAFNSTFSGKEDIFVAKFSSNCSLLWSTYLGGSSNEDPYGIAIAGDGSCYVSGYTNSNNFPTTKNAYDSTFNGGSLDGFVTKFSAAGALLWSTYLGGSGVDHGQGIAVTEDGICYVAGITGSTDFPTQNAYDSTSNGDLDAFITKFSTQGSLLWSTYLGGVWWDEACGITVVRDGSCYVTGFTGSIDFPSLNAYNNTLDIWGDAFVVKFATDGSLLWSTFLGGNGVDRGFAIAATSDGSCYVTGETCSTNFPTKNTYDSSKSGEYDAFVTKYSSDGFLLWSTYLGGILSDEGSGIAVTEYGYCYVTGTTRSTDFPKQNAFDNRYVMSEGFVTVFIEPLQPSSAQYKFLYGFLAFIFVMLLVVLIFYKKRK